MLVYEKTGENILEEEYLQEELNQNTFLKDAEIYADRHNMEGEIRERFLKNMEKFSEHFGDDTVLHWYNDMYALAGSSGLILLRKGTNKVVSQYMIMRS